MSLTGENLITCFSNSAEAKGKIFFQTEKDEVNAERLVRFFTINGGPEMASQCIERFMKNEKQPVVFLLDFVVKLGTLVEEIKIENEDREDFRRLLRETQERMKGDSH
jgi:hypothetical protein